MGWAGAVLALLGLPLDQNDSNPIPFLFRRQVRGRRPRDDDDGDVAGRDGGMEGCERAGGQSQQCEALVRRKRFRRRWQSNDALTQLVDG